MARYRQCHPELRTSSLTQKGLPGTVDIGRCHEAHVRLGCGVSLQPVGEAAAGEEVPAGCPRVDSRDVRSDLDEGADDRNNRRDNPTPVIKPKDRNLISERHWYFPRAAPSSCEVSPQPTPVPRIAHLGLG